MIYFIYLFLYRSYKERVSSLILIILYILVFRLPFLILILDISTTNIILIKISKTDRIIALLIVIVFINKIPLYGFHYWLLKAHSYCTTWGRVILARIILKVGLLGLIYLYQIVYVLVIYVKYYLYIRVCISRINILYLTDVKMIIAQTRVTHITFLGVRLLLDSSIRIKLAVIFGFIHGVVRILMFTISEVLRVLRKSRNIILLKKIYVIRIIFIGVILINNSFPITPYIWCELWIFIIITIKVNTVRCGLIIIIIIVTCNILFYQWVVMIKHQYLDIISDIKYIYVLLCAFPIVIQFFIMWK